VNSEEINPRTATSDKEPRRCADARAAYRSWEWMPAGEVKPFEDSQTFDAMVLDLAIRSN
jgi:hypothetical protein